MKPFLNLAIIAGLLLATLSADGQHRLHQRDTSQLLDNTIFAVQDTSTSGYKWVKTPYSVLRDSIHTSYNNSYTPIRFGAPTFKSHLDVPGSGSFGNGTSVEFGDTTHWSLTGRTYNLDYFENEFNFFSSNPGANLADTSSFRTSFFGLWNGNIVQTARGASNLRFTQTSITTNANAQIYKNPNTSFLVTKNVSAGVQVNGKTLVYKHLPPHTNIFGTMVTAVYPRDGDSTRLSGAIIGSWGISTGADTLSGDNINSQFRLALARNKSNTLELAFYISDTTFKWQGEMYESPASGIAFFDEKGALQKDTGYQVQAIMRKALSYQPASATDFQAELTDRDGLPNGAKFYFHAAEVSYEYIYDKERDKLKRVLYAEF